MSATFQKDKKASFSLTSFRFSQLGFKFQLVRFNQFYRFDKQFLEYFRKKNNNEKKTTKSTIGRVFVGAKLQRNSIEGPCDKEKLFYCTITRQLTIDSSLIDF